MTETIRKSLLRKLVSSGYQVSPDALDYITSLDTPYEVVEMILEGGLGLDVPSVISRDFVASFLDTTDEQDASDYPLLSEREETAQLEVEVIKHEEPAAEESGRKIRILKDPQFSNVGSAGTIEDFADLFEDRFERMKRIYMSRIDTANAISPKTARQQRADARRTRLVNKESGKRERRISQTVIGIVSNKSVASHSHNIILELEDSEGTITCIIPSGREGLNGARLLENGNSVLLDEVLCVSGYVDPDGRLIANDIIFPDIPTAREIGRAKRDVYAAFISDTHCGSKEFLEDEFDSFIDWLNLKDVDTEDREKVKKIEYLFIAGDLVDGIGVYPNQENDLQIPDVVGQYELVAKKLRRVPKRITMITIPGNHDASRQALPKPPVPELFAEPLYDLGDRMMLMGDPCQVLVEGVNVLITHGDAMDDLVVNTPGASYISPAIGMKELLRKRHLAPLYGGKTELAPLQRDWMVIETPPDIVHFGHAHHNCVDNYRGVQIINSGTFQSQTDFMRKQGIIPTPGIVTLVNLHTGAPEVKLFYDLSKMGNGSE